MPNFPGPNIITFVGSDSGINHTYSLSCDVDGDPTPGTDESTIDLVQRDGLLVNVESALTALLDLYKPRFATTYSFGDAILWKAVPDSFEKTFITTLSSAVSGTGATPTVPAHQTIYTFRTQEGNHMKITHLEDIADDNFQRSYSELGPSEKALADFIISPSNWVMAYDTSYPIGFIRGNFGQNEAIWRKRFRP